MVEKLNKIIHSKYFPYFIFAVVLVAYHFLIRNFDGDDQVFAEMFENGLSVGDFVVQRYSTWSSRIVIELVIVFLINFGLFVWRILDIGIFLILAKSIMKICSKSKNNILGYLTCALVILLPVQALNNTGWISTTTNYLWVASLGMFVISILVDYSEKKKIPIYMYPLYVLACIYSANQEQMVAVLFLIFAGFIAYNVWKNKIGYVLKNQKFLIVLLCIIIVSLFIILLCPGNGLRRVAETERWYPEFDNFSLIDKAELGLLSTMEKLLFNNYIGIVAFTISCFIGVCIFEKKTVYKIISAIPLFMSVFFVYFIDYVQSMTGKLFDLISKFKDTEHFIEIGQYNLEVVLVSLIYIMFFVLIVFSLYRIFKRTTGFVVASSIFILGTISRFIMALSPTIYASGDRTFIFMYIAFIACTIMIVDEIIRNKKINQHND